MGPIETALIALVGVLLFAGFFAAVMLLIAHLSGWQRLAETYRSDWPHEGTVHRFQTGQLRYGTNYGNCLTLTLSDEGLKVAVLPPFRPGHPPLLFPWGEIAVTRERNWLGMEYVTLSFSREPGVPMRIARGVGRAIEARVSARPDEHRFKTTAPPV